MNAIDVELVKAPTGELRELIDELDRALAPHYSSEQKHGLTFDGLFAPHVRFFIARQDAVAVGCGGVALLDGFAEVKRMFVRVNARGRGVAQAVLRRIERETADSGRTLLRLETGDRQVDAMRLYERAGFRSCAAFGDYTSMSPQAIATSVFLEKRLTAPA